MTLVRSAGILVLLTLGAFYPFLPGDYDGLAVAVSLVAQILGAAGLLFVPIGALWLAHKLRKGAHERSYALAAAILYLPIAVIMSLAGWVSSGFAFGCGVLAVSSFVFVRLRAALRRANSSHPLDFGYTPFYLTVLPLVGFVLQLVLASPVTEWSRTRAIANSTELIDALEQYHAAYGRYPESMAAVWPDYKVSVVGIAQFHYAPHGDGYNLYFEQPLPLISAPGTREFVVYNPRGEHLILSHAAWHLAGPPTELPARQGWHSVSAASQPHWKRFRFD
ncbi:hypothetical protein BH18ACI5_BH18ACI5_03990 [soil metagenome]